MLKRGAYRSVTLGKVHCLLFSCARPDKSNLVTIAAQPLQAVTSPHLQRGGGCAPGVRRVLDLHFVSCSADRTSACRYFSVIPRGSALPVYRWHYCLAVAVKSVHVPNVGCWVFWRLKHMNLSPGF